MPGAKPPAAAAKPAEKPGVERGDHIYFHNGKGKPFKGRVLAAGEHGCTVHHPETNKRHKVRWEQYLGHAHRVQPALAVIEEGEDGFLAKDASNGKVRYVHDPLVDSEGSDGSLMKSLMLAANPERLVGGQTAIERLVALKREQVSPLAKALANRPGLALQPVTDKAGHQTKRWKKTAPKEPKGREKAKPKLPPEHRDAAAGDQVKFKVGTLEGEGAVVAHGHAGVQVKDAEGEIHKVAWGHVQDRQKPAGGQPKKPAPREEGESDKAYAKRVVDHEDAPDSIPEKHESYFHTEGSSKLAVKNMRSSKTEEENKQGGDNGPKRMAAAAQGRLSKRDPIKVHANEDGTHTVVDGNGTFTSVKAHGWEHIPAHVVQPDEDKDALWKSAGEALEHLKTWLNKGQGLCDQMGFRTVDMTPGKLSDEELSRPGGILSIAPLKGEERASQKVKADYGGDWSRLKDVVRCTLAVDSLADLHSTMSRLKAGGLVVAQPPKDRFAKPTALGYRDMNLVIRAPNGHLMEMQLNVKPMLIAKKTGHKAYEVTRSLSAKYGDNTDVTSWDDADQKAFRDACEAQTTIYDQAYAKVSGEK